MAKDNIRTELDELQKLGSDNGINGKPIIETINGWEVTKSANGRRVARISLTYDLYALTNIGTTEMVEKLTQSFEETLPVGVFTGLPEDVKCMWRSPDSNCLFIDTVRSVYNLTTTGKHRAIIKILGEVAQPPTEVLVDWIVTGYYNLNDNL